MVNTLRLALSALAVATLLAAAPTGHAAGAQFQGLLRSRDLTTFGFQRLDMRPAPATTSAPETWSLEAVLGYQNTWALSHDVERYLKSVQPEGRRDLSARQAEILALPGENFLVDVESANLDFILSRRLSTNWTGYAIAGLASFQGGFLDGFIEGFHDTFGFGQAGRRASSRNQANAIYGLKTAPYTGFDEQSRSGLTDPTFGVRYTASAPWQGWAFSVEGAVKIPIARERTVLSSGRTDVGIQGALQRGWNRNALYFDFAAVYYAGADNGPVPEDAQLIPTLVIGYEHILGARTNLVLQGYASRAVYSHRQTDLDELLATKYLLTLGIRQRLDRIRLSFGITENVLNTKNTPDISAQIGIAWASTN